MNDFWVNVVSKAVGRERKMPAPTIRQTPAEPNQPTMKDYLAATRDVIPTARPASVEERFGGTAEYARLDRFGHIQRDGDKISVARRDSSEITVHHGPGSWQTNSRQVTDQDVFGIVSTPQERAAAYQMALRDGQYITRGKDPMYDGMTPWQHQQMANDRVKSGEFTDAGHGDGGWFDATNPGRQ